MVISAYEKQRLENIERNKELLRQLNIPKLDVPQRTTATRSSSVKKHTPKKGPKERQAPTRVSARLRGIAASEVPDHDDLKRGRSPGGSDDPEAKKAKRIDRLDDYQQKEFMDVLKSVRKAPNTEPAPRKPQKKDMDAEEALRQHASQLQIRHTWATVKVTPDRINGCVFHPSNVKLLAIAADTTGHLGFWDVNGSKVEEEDDEEEPVVYTYRPHTRTITNLKFNPVDEQRLYTSSYDGTMQYFDMAKGAFESVSLGGEEYPITNFDWTVNGKSVWFCTSDGEVAQHDLRSRTKPKVHSIKDKKIGCVSVNPTHEHLIAVASNDRTATVWDVRAMGKEPLHEFTHGFSVTSAYWSPRGDKLATTAYDDYVRIFELADNGEISLQSAISHNTHTGRWVTNLRARWNENNVSHVANGIDHQHFVIGSMSHPVKIISGETGNEITELYDPDRITAVPAVAQFHPRTESMTILCGNGSGRMVCWS